MRTPAWTRSLLAGLLICLMGSSYIFTAHAQQPRAADGPVGVDQTSKDPELESKPAAAYEIEPKLTAPGVPKTVISAGQERPVGLLRAPDGAHQAFVIDEVTLRAETREELNAFLEKYDATILKDGSVSLPAELRVRHVPRSNWYLIRVNLTRSSLDDLPSNMTKAGIKGTVVFSSENAARLTAVVAREARKGAWANMLVYGTSSLEHADYSGGHLDAETFPWMQEDSDDYRDGDQGFSVGVTHAWDALAYKQIPPTSGSWSPVRVAVVDNGFALSTATGAPLLSNVDYFNSLSAPLQYDVSDEDGRAGGASDVDLDGGGSSLWHGQKAFGVCCAAERNQFGSAGTGGPVAQPILIRAGGTMYSLADAIYEAANMGAHVINVSMGADCGLLCVFSDIFWDNQIGDAVIAATNVGAVVVAGAGNQGLDLANLTYLPCELLDVICVGSVRLKAVATGETVTDTNYGALVDISAPQKILSTVTPDAVAFDADDFATGPGSPDDDELAAMTGTSAAAAFVSGVIALMKAANPSLNTDEVQSILQTTANPSTDARVPRGYVDAFRAVVATLPNEPPTVEILSPTSGLTFGSRTPPLFTTAYSDPEIDPANTNAIYRFHGEVVYTSQLDGELCRSSSPPYTCSTTLPQLRLGTHVITATASDFLGTTATDQITLNVVNRPPTPQIIRPSVADMLYTHVPVHFTGYAPDPDQNEPVAEANTKWVSSLDGVLGTGPDLSRQITAGTHTITFTAIDDEGLAGSAQVTISVLPGAGLPIPQITMPAAGVLVAPGQQVTLQAVAIDPEDGALTGQSLEWSSSIDGALGTGTSMQVVLSAPTNLCYGHNQHTITLKATDSDGHAVSAKSKIYVGIIC
jgi:serine protease